MEDFRGRFMRSCVLGLLLVGNSAQAEEPRPNDARPPQGVVALNSSATVEVAKDWMHVTLSATREGPDATTVQRGLKDALDAALAQARRVLKPNGQVEMRTGAFALRPRYGSKGAMTGWSGTTELVVEGRDMATIADLAGRISSMTVARTDFSISREASDKIEAEVATQAIARFRANAAAYAKAFGYGSFAVREVAVSTQPVETPMPRAYAAKAGAAEAYSDALPMEAGKGAVTVMVNGTVQMK